MKWKMINVPLGANNAPFGISKKCNPLVAPAAIAAGASLASGIGSLFSQADTNKTNTKLVRETNAQNKELFERNLAWQEDMWNKTNEYNDPSQQVERLLKAGINPAYVLGNGSMAEASTMSSPAAPTLQAPQIEALNYGQIGAAAERGVNTYMNARMQKATIANLESQSNKTDAETLQINKGMPAYIQHLESMAKGEGYKADLARTELSYLQAVNGQRISQAFGNTKLLDRQIKQADEQYLGYQLQNKLAQVQLAYAPKLNEAQLQQYYTSVNEMKATIALTMARADLTYQQKLSEIEHRTGVIIENGMKGLDFDIKKATKSTAIDLVKQELGNLEWKTEQNRVGSRYGIVGQSARGLINAGIDAFHHNW